MTETAAHSNQTADAHHENGIVPVTTVEMLQAVGGKRHAANDMWPSAHAAPRQLTATTMTTAFAELSGRSLMLLNGLAAVAVLAFAGQAPKALAQGVAPALNAFGWGATLAVVTALAAYLAHALFMRDEVAYERKCYGGSLNVVAATAGMISIGSFLYGLTLAARALG